MKKYLIFAMIFFSFSALASKDSASLGENSPGKSMNDCNAAHVVGCGPCYKLCIEQNKSERGQIGERNSDRKQSTGKNSSAVGG